MLQVAHGLLEIAPSKRHGSPSLGWRFLVPQPSRGRRRASHAHFGRDFRDMETPTDARLRMEVKRRGKLAGPRGSIIAAPHWSAHPFILTCNRWCRCAAARATRKIRSLRSVASRQTLCSFAVSLDKETSDLKLGIMSGTITLNQLISMITERWQSG